ncbi:MULTISPECIES: hypothetical protein [unclassified Oceanispirochaeta]|uniref:hypothetical protein n=1 Tax=unclassified Oceanispirochaeta TaxID=2635722 RepID=UPI000E08DB32|nr:MULTISPECIES: hypothetical protein [unclassified Oceanispirochaeta]MBF9018025.1 hypothetical protein [Oceanispirochaeta sp. M2]NPD74537.1 hypothetical protein [Oceanispirochaeta sp. M1]RDG29649.1 hypothetical protein DV872_20755 [Oceanispirochaeta sp. M1]
MSRSAIHNAFDDGKGILRLTPTWVPRSFCVPGRRIKLHPDDYYAMGGHRGGIDERWFSSTTPADNGPDTSENEGLSFVLFEKGGESEQFLLRDAVEELKGSLIGNALWQSYGKWPMFSKFFDNLGPLPHHIHHRDKHASLVGEMGKPEAYYFPPQLNNHGGDFPHTFFGLKPGTTRKQVLDALKAFNKGDNGITNLSTAYKLVPGTGWNVPPGVLHAPGSFCTYEPQMASDVFAMYQSLVNNQIIDESLLWKNTPEDKRGDFDYLIDVIDWDLNVDPLFSEHNFMEPLPVYPQQEMEGYIEKWICYKTKAFSAKELTIHSGRTVTIKDSAPYGMYVIQGHGRFGGWNIESPALIRYGQHTNDEFFVSEQAAREGVEVSNSSDCDDLVILKHFGAGNPDLKVN